MRTQIELRPEEHSLLWRHLLQSETEQAAFVFADIEVDDDAVRWRSRDHLLVPPDGFAFQSDYHIELADEMRASVIKHAFQLGAGLVELHSHPHAGRGVRFSGSDLLGFKDFVPHIFWRLPRRPYLALVVGNRDFDALAWIDDPSSPVPLGRLMVDGRIMRPTGRTFGGDYGRGKNESVR